MFARQRSEIQRLQSQRPAAGSRLDPNGQRGRVALKTRSAVAQDAFVFLPSHVLHVLFVHPLCHTDQT